MSEKNLDAHGRMRSKTISFRMSPEEADLLDNLVAISGQTKQDYIIRKLLDRRVVIVPSSRMQKGMEKAMMLIYRELLRLANCADASPELLALTDSVSVAFSGLGAGSNDVRLAGDESVIKNLKRNPNATVNS